MNDKYTDLEEVVQQVNEGVLTEDAAAKILARRALVDEAVAKMAISARLYAIAGRTANKQQRSSPSEIVAASAVPGSVFNAVLEMYDLNQTQAAKIIGRSASRVHELVTRGGSVGLFERFKQNIEDWAHAQSS